MNTIREHLVNPKRIWRMAIISVKEEFRGAKLGIVWEIIRTAVFFAIYGSFFIVLRGRSDYESILTLFAALLPFQLIATVINQTPRVYKKNKVLVTTIKFPLSIIPTFDILGKFIIHLISMAILILIFSVMGYLQWNYLYVIYYYVALLFLLLGMMMILSLVCSISVDIYKMWQVVTRVFIYLNPVFWSVSTIKNVVPSHSYILTIVKLNPFVYVLEGFKRVMVKGQPAEFSLYTLYFWVFIVGLIALGSYFQKKILKLLPDII